MNKKRFMNISKFFIVSFPNFVVALSMGFLVVTFVLADPIRYLSVSSGGISLGSFDQLIFLQFKLFALCALALAVQYILVSRRVAKEKEVIEREEREKRIPVIRKDFKEREAPLGETKIKPSVIQKKKPDTKVDNVN